MTNKLKRFGLFGFVIMLVGIQLVIPLSRVHADTPKVHTADEVFKAEYLHWKAARILAFCINSNLTSSSTAPINKAAGWDKEAWLITDGQPDGKGGFSEGILFNDIAEPKPKIDANDISCRDSSSMVAVAKILGFEDFDSLNDWIFPNDQINSKSDVKGDFDSKTNRWKMNPNVAKFLPAKVDQNAVFTQFFNMFISADGNKGDTSGNARYDFKGPDNDGGLSDGAKFWYWQSTILHPSGGSERRGCGGKFLFENSPEVTNHTWDTFDENHKDKAKEFWSKNDQVKFHMVDSNGDKQDYTRVTYDYADDIDISTLDKQFMDIGANNPLSFGTPTCHDMARLASSSYMDAWRSNYIAEKDRLKAEYDKQIADAADADYKTCLSQGGNTADCAAKKADAITKGQAAYNAALAAQSSAASGGGDITFKCDVKLSSPISWFMCPLVDGFSSAINSIDTQINNMLTIDTGAYFQGTTGDGFKEVWKAMRDLSIGFLVIIGLIMVIGTAVGVGVFDAYTVKKIFPRLLMAIVAISVSWYAVIFIIDVSNSLGYGVRSLIQAPFSTAFSKGVTLDGGQLSLGALGVVGLGIGLGLLGVLSFVVTAFLAVAVAFLTLILRQLLVILLAVMAPVAIVAYILPNTQKAGKLWWDFFSKALLAFPIISGFIAIGRVFAVVSQNSSGAGTNAGTIRGLIGFIAYFAPYFMLPKAFAMAGGALGNLSGAINNNGKGAFDRLRGFRSNQTKSRYQDAVEGKSRLGQSPVGSVYRRAALAGQGGLSPTARGRHKYAAASQKLFDKTAAKMLEDDGGRMTGDDDANALALQEGMTARRFIAEYNRRTNSTRGAETLARLETGYGARIGSDAMRVAAFKAKSASNTGYAVGDAGAREMQEEAATMINSGLMTEVDVVKAFKSNRERADVNGEGFADQLNRVTQSAQRQRAGQAVISDDEIHTMRRRQLQGVQAGVIMGGHRRGVQTLAPYMHEQAANAITNGNDDEAIRELASIGGKLDMAASAAPQNAQQLSMDVLSQEMDVSTLSPAMRARLAPALIETQPDGSVSSKLTGTITYGAALEALRSDEYFGSLRREYGSQNAAAAAAARGGGDPLGGPAGPPTI